MVRAKSGRASDRFDLGTAPEGVRGMRNDLNTLQSGQPSGRGHVRPDLRSRRQRYQSLTAESRFKRLWCFLGRLTLRALKPVFLSRVYKYGKRSYSKACTATNV